MRLRLLPLLLLACGPQPAQTFLPIVIVGGGAGGGSVMQAPRRIDGTVGTWEAARPLPVARANHCSVAVGDFLVVAGGNYKPAGGTSFLTLDGVVSAKQLADGTLTAWSAAGTLPSPATDCVLAASGSTVVLLGGIFDDNTLNAKVWSTTLGDDGKLGRWQELGALPYGRRAISAGAYVKDDELWVTDTLLPSEGVAEAIVAHAKLGAALGPWVKTVYQTSFRGKPLGAFTKDAAFIAGGYGDGNTVLTDVTAVPLSGDAPASTTPLPEGRTFGAAASVDGWLFVTGGRNQVLGVPPVSSIWSARADGSTVGPWTAQLALPEPRSNHTATVVGDWLFVIGGGNNSGGLDTVFRARVKHLIGAQ